MYFGQKGKVIVITYDCIAKGIIIMIRILLYIIYASQVPDDCRFHNLTKSGLLASGPAGNVLPYNC